MCILRAVESQGGSKALALCPGDPTQGGDKGSAVSPGHRGHGKGLASLPGDGTIQA